ncbi:MAG: hypothetical protein ACYC6J_09415 [Coriobacteriia bacterium]
METVKIVRINGEYQEENNGSCGGYITPYTGYEHNHWFVFNEGKAIFDKLNFNCLTKQDKDLMPEYKRTKEQLELEVIESFEMGDIPHIFLFSYDIPKKIWDNKENLAVENGYSDDWMTYITDLTNYHWNLEIDRVIDIPKNILKKHQSIAV